MELILDAPANEDTTIQVKDGILLWEDLLDGQMLECWN